MDRSAGCARYKIWFPCASGTSIECTCYHPLFVFNQFGDLERCALRPGNVHSAEGWRGVLEPVVERYRQRDLRRYFRGDAAFASPDIYEFLEAEDYKYTIRLKANAILQERIGYLLTRPVGRRPIMWSAPMPASAIRQGHGTGSAASLPKLSGIPANSIPPTASSSPTCRDRPNAWSPSTTSAAPANSGSKKAKAQSSGPDCHAGCSQPTPSASSFMLSPTISATSWAPWQRPSRSGTGR